MDSKLQGKIFWIVPSIFSCSPSNMGHKLQIPPPNSKHTIVLFLTNWKFLEGISSLYISIWLLEMGHQRKTTHSREFHSVWEKPDSKNHFIKHKHLISEECYCYMLVEKLPMSVSVWNWINKYALNRLYVKTK